MAENQTQRRTLSWPEAETLLAWLFARLSPMIHPPLPPQGRGDHGNERGGSFGYRNPRDAFSSPRNTSRYEGDGPSVYHHSRVDFRQIEKYAQIADQIAREELLEMIAPGKIQSLAPMRPPRRPPDTPLQKILNWLRGILNIEPAPRENYFDETEAWLGLNRNYPPDLFHALLPVGAFRRRETIFSQISLVAASSHPELVQEYLRYLPFVTEIDFPENGVATLILSTAHLGIVPQSVEVVFFTVSPQEFLTTVLCETSSQEDWDILVERAKENHLQLRRSGLYRSSGERVELKSLAELFEAIQTAPQPPERFACGFSFPKEESSADPLVSLCDIRADLHLHTTYSDGSGAPEDMVAEAISRSLSYIALTDHTERCYAARGMDSNKFRNYWRRIDQINARLASMGKEFRLLKGAEVDILPDGSLDLEDDLLRQSDWIVASLHCDLSQPRSQIHERVERALANPYVCVMAHPTGRTFNSTFVIDLDTDFLLDCAQKYGKALEINSQPRRIDLDEMTCVKAKERGIPLVISTDSHAVAHMDYIRYGINAARRSGLTQRDVLNTYTLEELLAWRKKRLEALL